MSNRFFDDSTSNVENIEKIEVDENQSDVSEKKEEEVSNSNSEGEYLLSDIGRPSYNDEENDFFVKEHTCPKCGIMYYNSGSDSSCILCGCESSSGTDELNTDNYYYLPFDKTIDDAIKEYKKSVRWKLFIPLVFRKKHVFSCIKKVYCPVLVKSCKVGGQVVFYAADNDRTTKKLMRYEVCNTLSVEYENIVFSLSSKFDHKKIDVMSEYDYKNSLTFDNNLFSDKSLSFIKDDIKNYDEVISNEIKKQAVNIVRERINHDLKKIKENNTIIDTISEMKIFLPAYVAYITNKDKNSLFLMNGQNGNSYLESEVSKIGVVVISVIIFIFIFMIVFLILNVI